MIIAERRLADSISLVRWMTERSVHLLSRKPFLVIFTHMAKLLVHGYSIFPPASLDYPKAIRALLSYPPHLENLDAESWKVLMGICWAAVLGDEVRVDNDWDDEDEAGEVDTKDDDSTYGQHAKRTTISQSSTELVSLIPMLLSSSAAPLLPPTPGVSTDSQKETPAHVGYSILLKIHRFFLLHPTETSVHLAILRSLNIILAELELNSRGDFTSAGIKLFPQLVSLWGTRSKGLREQVLIALRLLMPSLTHGTSESKDKDGIVREGIRKLMDGLARESLGSRGIEPLDINVVRLSLMEEDKDDLSGSRPFQTRAISVS
jgi:ataxia telangiectasia mutated family protein